jgi:hypothetical protein
MTELEFTGYRQSDGLIIPFSGGMVKRLSLLRSVAVVTSRWWDEVLSRSTSIAARVRALHATAWMRLAIDRRVNRGAEVAAKHWRSISAEFGRWRDEVLLPRVRSIGVHLKAIHENTWLRLAEAKRKRQRSAQAEPQACESVDAETVQWWDGVLLPRTRLVAARFKALHENALLRLAQAKQERHHRAQVERQAWESVDADIMRWWNEVLLPRTRLIASRFKALHENSSLRLAQAKQERHHRAQVERQAWESVDADIMRWWNEVLLPRIRFYRRPN